MLSAQPPTVCARRASWLSPRTGSSSGSKSKSPGMGHSEQELRASISALELRLERGDRAVERGDHLVGHLLFLREQRPHFRLLLLHELQELVFPVLHLVASDL